MKNEYTDPPQIICTHFIPQTKGLPGPFTFSLYSRMGEGLGWFVFGDYG